MNTNNFPLFSEPCNEVTQALKKVMQELPYEEFKKVSDAYQHKFMPYWLLATLSREPLLNNDLVMTQSCIGVDGVDYGVTTLLHTSGQWLKSYCRIDLGSNPKNYMQEIGKGFTYTRRYTCQALLNIAPLTDDDATSLADVKRTVSWGTQLNAYQLTVEDINEWCRKTGQRKNWYDWNDKQKGRFVQLLHDGKTTAKDILEVDPDNFKSFKE